MELAIQKLPTTPPDQPSQAGSGGGANRNSNGNISSPVVPRSPHAGEESAQPLALPVPSSFFSTQVLGSGEGAGGGAASFVDDTRRFLQNAGDTISKPLSALGRIVGEALDSAEGRLPSYLPGPLPRWRLVGWVWGMRLP